MIIINPQNSSSPGAYISSVCVPWLELRLCFQPRRSDPIVPEESSFPLALMEKTSSLILPVGFLTENIASGLRLRSLVCLCCIFLPLSQVDFQTVTSLPSSCPKSSEVIAPVVPVNPTQCQMSICICAVNISTPAALHDMASSHDLGETLHRRKTTMCCIFPVLAAVRVQIEFNRKKGFILTL